MFVRENGLLTASLIQGPIFQKGPMDILIKTVRNEGFFALYKGTHN